jgi:hypothetical protein
MGSIPIGSTFSEARFIIRGASRGPAFAALGGAVVDAQLAAVEVDLGPLQRDVRS